VPRAEPVQRGLNVKLRQGDGMTVTSVSYGTAATGPRRPDRAPRTPFGLWRDDNDRYDMATPLIAFRAGDAMHPHTVVRHRSCGYARSWRHGAAA